jgi:cephalosporin hydroxylase
MISINLDKAKTISHAIRRQRRTEEFDPLDQVIMRKIPGTDVVAIEAQRQLIRDKYAEIQINIDSAQDSNQLLAVLQIT